VTNRLSHGTASHLLASPMKLTFCGLFPIYKIVAINSKNFFLSDKKGMQKG
jgi:hypothetical protein